MIHQILNLNHLDEWIVAVTPDLQYQLSVYRSLHQFLLDGVKGLHIS